MKIIILITMSLMVQQLSAQTITNYTTADGLVSDFVECVAVDINDNIWFGTSVGVQMFDGSNWVNYSIATYPGMAFDNIKVISAMANGDIWIGTDFGASRFNGVDWTTYTVSTMQSIPLISNQIKSIDEDPNTGIIWIGTNLGVTPLDLSGATNSLSIGSSDLHWSGVNATTFDSNGDIWLASPLGGITHFDGTTFTPYDTANGLLSQYVTALLIDNQDNKWVGTSSGMSVLDASNTYFTQHTRMYIMPPPDTLNPVVDIAMDSYGRIWTAIYVGYLAEGGVAMWDGNQWEDFHVSDGLAGPNVRGLAIDSEDNVWVATSTGVSKISAIPSAINTMPHTNTLIYPNPTSAYFKVVSSEDKFNNVSVYNNLGAIVYAEDFNFIDEIQLNFSSFSKGLYHIILSSDKSIENHKILIE